MSGNDDSTPLGEAIAVGNRFAEESVGCTQRGVARITCLRALDAWSLVNYQSTEYNQSMRALQVCSDDPMCHGRMIRSFRFTEYMYSI